MHIDRRNLVIVFYLAVCIIFSISVSAQSSKLQLFAPDSTVAMETNECQGDGECKLPIVDVAKMCSQEGQYKLKFTVGGNDQANYADLNTHIVLWDTSTYCKGNNYLTLPVCFANKTVNWSTANSRCCGAHPAENCGLRMGSEACVNPSMGPETWKWAKLTSNKADIFNLQCAQAQLLSDGTDFYLCGIGTGSVNTYKTFTLINMTKTGVGDKPAHSYLCAEDTPSNNDSYRNILECSGDDPAYDTQDGRVAQIGESHTAGELYATSLLAAESVRTGTLANFNSTRGHIVLSIRNTWEGKENLNRVLFHAKEAPDAYLSIEKVDTRIICKNVKGTGRIEAIFDVASWMPNQEHTIILDYNADASSMSCALDGQKIERTGFVEIKAIEMYINAGPPGSISAASPITISVSENPQSPTFYCAKDAEWTRNLDNKDPLTCKLANLRWTGTKCCGERDDWPNESYQDPNLPDYKDDESGACFTSRFASNGYVLNNTNGSVLTILGQFFGCQLNETNPNLLAMKDSHNGKPLINDTNRCTLAYNATRNVNINYYCSFNGTWTTTPKQHKLKPKYVIPEVRNQLPPPINNTSRDVECCAETSCWNGITCVADQTLDSRPSTTGGYRCLAGDWVYQPVKATWDDQNKGYCPNVTQCLVNPLGNISLANDPDSYFTTKQPACINDGKSIRQYHCATGNWSSRTKSLAMYLVDYAETNSVNNYSVFCDYFNETLNFIDYEAFPNAGPVRSYLEEPCIIRGTKTSCINQFCVLISSKGVAFGTSLNVAVNDSIQSFLPALGKSTHACDNALAEGDNLFHTCGNGINYNPGLNSIIYLPSGSLSAIGPTEMDARRWPALSTRFGELVTYAARPTLADMQSILSSTTIFDTLYYNRKAPKDLFSLIQRQRYVNGTRVDYTAARYVNINITDPTGMTGCDLLNNKIRTDLPRDCTQSGNTLKFAAFTTSSWGNLNTVWRDLGAKLR